MSEQKESSGLTLCRLTPEQMAIIQGKEQQFLTVFKQQLAEQAKTNELLILLIQALATEQDDQDPDSLATTYMDGTPVRGLP